MSVKTFQTAGNWNTAGNWSPVGAPLAGDDVVIAADCVLDVATPELASLTVNLGMQLDLDGYDLTTSGTIDVNGTLLGGEGTITITGNGDFDYKDGTFTCETSTVDLQGTGKWRLQDVSSADPVYNLKCAYSGKTTSAVKLNTGTADVKRELRPVTPPA